MVARQNGGDNDNDECPSGKDTVARQLVGRALLLEAPALGLERERRRRLLLVLLALLCALVVPDRVGRDVACGARSAGIHEAAHGSSQRTWVLVQRRAAERALEQADLIR